MGRRGGKEMPGSDVCRGRGGEEGRRRDRRKGGYGEIRRQVEREMDRETKDEIKASIMMEHMPECVAT